MTIKDVLLTWDRLFPTTPYPESWAIKMWCERYTIQELEHAAQVTALAVEQGRVLEPDIPRYVSGVLRTTKSQNIEVEAEIKKHIAAERGGHAFISI